MGLQLATAVIKVRADGSRLKTDLRGVKRNVTSSMKGIATSIKGIMGPMLAFAGVGAGVVAFQQLAVAGEDFNRKMRGSLAIMGDVSDTMRSKMRATAFAVAKDTKFGAGQAAESYFFLASAGLDAEQSIAGLPQVALFAQAGMFDMARATDLATDAQSALGMTVKDSQKNLENMTLITDTLVKANTMANASVEQFSEALTSDAATASRMMNMELKTTVALLALYAEKGKKGAEAGNLLGRATRLMSKAVRDNANVFKRLNIRAIDDATGEYRNFIDIIEDMNQAFAGMSKPEIGKALSDLGFEALAQKSILPLLNATATLKGYEKGLDDVGGTTKEIAGKQLTPFQKVMALLGATFTQVSASINKNLEPVFSTLLVRLKSGFSIAEKLSGIFPNMIQSIMRMSIAVVVLTTALVAARLATRLLGISMKAALIGTGIGIILVAIGAAVELLVNKFDLFKKAGPILDSIVKKFKGWETAIQTVVRLAGMLFSSLFTKIAAKWAILIWGLNFGIKAWTETVGERLKPVVEFFQNAFKFIVGDLNVLLGSWEGFFDTIDRWTVQIANAFQAAWRTATDAVARMLLSIKFAPQELLLTQVILSKKEALKPKGEGGGLGLTGELREDALKEIEKLEKKRKKLRANSNKAFKILEQDLQNDLAVIGRQSLERDEESKKKSFRKLSDLFATVFQDIEQEKTEQIIGESIRNTLKSAFQSAVGFFSPRAKAALEGKQDGAAGKGGKAERVGFTEFGNKIQDALLQRDDPAKETAKNTKETNTLIKDMATDVVKGLNVVAAKIGSFLT